MTQFQPPCHGQGHLPLGQVAQIPIQSGLEHFQGGGVHSFPGQSLPVTRVALCVSLFVLYILLTSIAVVTVLFVLLFCQTALIPTHQFLLFSLHSPSNPCGGRGNKATSWPFCCQPRPNYNMH